MKTSKLFTALLLACAASSASAQFVNSTESKSLSSPSARTVDTDSYNRIYISYDKIGFHYNGNASNYGDDLGLNGIQFGYMKGFSLTPRYSIYLEAGIALQYAFKTMDLADYDEDDGVPTILPDEDNTPSGSQLIYYQDYIESSHKYSLFTLQIPVNFVYKYAFNDNLAIAPFVGIDLKYHIIGKQTLKLEAEDDYGDEIMERNDWDDSYEANLFDKEDMGGKNSTAKRFQIGWHIGVGMDINNCFLSISYGKDFNDFMKKTKLSNMLVTLGYNF